MKRIFVTGASGFIGTAVVRELIAAGYHVTGLARSETAADALAAAGAEVFLGSLDDPASLTAGAAAADAVVHTAFNHDFSRFKENCELDRQAITALGEGLAGSTRPLVITSGIGILPGGALVNERTSPLSGEKGHPRAASEEAAAALLEKGVNVSIVRLPPSVHGEGDHGFIPILIRTARERGASAYIGTGGNRWPAVHRLDAAVLYRLALEKGIAGARYHAVAEEGIAFRQIAGSIGKVLGIPVIGISPDEAGGHFGWFARFAEMDVPASSGETRNALGWNSSHPDLLDDMGASGYFDD